MKALILRGDVTWNRQRGGEEGDNWADLCSRSGPHSVASYAGRFGHSGAAVLFLQQQLPLAWNRVSHHWCSTKH